MRLVRRNTETSSKWHLRAHDSAYAIGAACGPSVVIFSKDPHYAESEGGPDDVTCLRCRRTAAFLDAVGN